MDTKLFSLDERLLMCASLVRESTRLVDVGTDHAYLPVWLLKKGRISYAIASDINEKPLKSGRATAEKYTAENIEFRLGSGMETIAENDKIRDAVIAGMGGEIIAEIIAESPLSKGLNLVLQPMTKSEELISFLYKNGYEITEQKCVVSHDKCYTVIAARYSGKFPEIDEVFPYIGKLDLKNETNIRFIKGHIRHLENKARGDKSYLPLVEKLKKLIK